MWNLCLMGPYDQTDGIGTAYTWLDVLVLMIENAAAVKSGERNFYIYWSDAGNDFLTNEPR